MPEKITQVRIVESNHLSTVPLSLSERPLGHRPRYSTLERTDEEEVHVTLTGGERVPLSLSLSPYSITLSVLLLFYGTISQDG